MQGTTIDGVLDVADNAILTQGAVVRALGVNEQRLDEAHKAGKLKCVLIGRKRLYRGEWLRQWLEAAADRPEVATAN